MPQKILKLQKAIDFTNHNGYFLAVYQKKEDNYNLLTVVYDDTPSKDIDIVVQTIGAGTSFNEFTTVDKQYCFRLHNNFNIPKVIPIISRQ